MRRVLLVATALLLTGCGGGDEQKDAFVASAVEVCDRAAEQTEALTAPTKPADFAPYAEQLVDIAEQAQSDLEALALPEADADDLRSRVLEPFADVVEEGKAFATKVSDAGDDQAKLLPLLSQVPDAGEVDLEYLRDYGLDSCADAISRE